MNYGFVRPVIDSTHYVYGDLRLGAVPLNISGDWTEWLPSYEAQADLYETYGCTVWGSQNQLETLFKFLYKIEPNYSERFNYNLVKLMPPGADPQAVYESIRKHGVIVDSLLPLPATLDEFRTPRPVGEPYLSEGKKFTTKYIFDHDWVLKGTEAQDERIAKLKAGLQFSPLGVSVTAWFPEGDVYVDRGIPNNHWCLLYKIDDKYLYIFDTYDHSKKLLPHSHVISYAKRITLSEGSRMSILEKILQIIKEILGLQSQLVEMQKPPVPVVPLSKKLLDAAVSSIGTDASPLNLAPEELSCAEGLSNIINSVIPQFPTSILSTQQLKVCLDDDRHFERIMQPEAGCIIVSPRQLSTPGHCGIFADGSTIISNSSHTGLMAKNYTWDSWIAEMKDRRELKIYLWRVKVGL